MKSMYRDRIEYLLETTRNDILFHKHQIESQLDSVRKRTKALRTDFLVYFLIGFGPVGVFLAAYLAGMSGNVFLVILCVPLMFLSAGIFISMGIISMYKFLMCIFMMLFNRFGGNFTIFGKEYEVYTYKKEEAICMSKLTKLTGYLENIDRWMEHYEVGILELDSGYMEKLIGEMEIGSKVKISSLKDPIIARMSGFSIPLFLIMLLFVTLSVWGVNIFGLGKIYSSFSNL